MSSAEIHREPFIHLVDLGYDRALIAWGAFYFERTEHGRWEIVDEVDERLTVDRGGAHRAKHVECVETSVRLRPEITTQTATVAPPVGLEPTRDRLEGCCSIL